MTRLVEGDEKALLDALAHPTVQRAVKETPMRLFLDLPLGYIHPFLLTSLPDGWIPCDGRRITRAEYPDLFIVLAPHYKHDESSVVLPDAQSFRTWHGGGGGPVLSLAPDAMYCIKARESQPVSETP